MVNNRNSIMQYERSMWMIEAMHALGGNELKLQVKIRQ